jgi:hypothetical protein
MWNRVLFSAAIGGVTLFLTSSFALSMFNAAAATNGAETAAVADEIEPVEDSMHEFMEYVFQPAYLRLKENLREEPRNNREWKPLKSDALILAESCNLLFGRKPEQDAADWVRHAVAARNDGAAVYKAAGERDFGATVAAFKTMLNSCNACHRQFEDGKHILQP